MPEEKQPPYYCTQSRLARDIALKFYDNKHFVYVADVYDATNNHPTSHPKYLRELWCEVMSLTETECIKLFDEKDELKDRALLTEDKYPMMKIWFDDYASGGAEDYRKQQRETVDRWISHQKTLKIVAYREIFKKKGDKATYDKVVDHVDAADRLTDAFPIVYRVVVDSDRFVGKKNPYVPGPKYPDHWQEVVPDLELIKESEVTFVEKPCGDPIDTDKDFPHIDVNEIEEN